MRDLRSVALSMVLLGACASTATMRTAPLSEGRTRVFPGSYDRVLTVARTSVAEAGFRISEINKIDSGATSIIGQNAGGVGSYGERVRVAVMRTSDSTATVSILTKKKLATNVFAKGDWSDVIFSLIESRMKTTTP